MSAIVIVSVFFVVMWLVEQWRPGRRWPQRRAWFPRALLFNGAQAAVAALGAFTWDAFFPGLSLWSVSSWGLWAGALTGYVAITFIYYWWHRARHEVPVLWRGLHQLHHSPQRLEVLTSFYKHPLEIALNGMLSSVVLYVLVGADPMQAGMAVLLTGIAELFYHWNVRTPYWLGFVIQRPESHCVHHERGRHTHNYSDLPLWDMLFGTFKNPRATQFECGFEGEQELEIGTMLAGRLPVAKEANHAH